MELVPYIGDDRLSVSDLVVRVNPEDRERTAALIKRLAAVTEVTDEASFQAARRAAGEAKAMLQEIEAAKRLAKQPFTAVNRAMDQLTTEVATPVEAQHRRILELLNRFVSEAEAKEKAAQRARENALRLQAEALQRQLDEASKRAREAEEEARAAKDAAARADAQRELEAKRAAAAEAQVDIDMAAELAKLGAAKPKPGLVPGGRVDHNWKFELESVYEVVKSGHWKLLRWSLDVRACQDFVRGQLERADPDAKPKIPGIKITRETNVSVRAQARTE